MTAGRGDAEDDVRPGEAPAAGWYPQEDGSQRYWDGFQWTGNVVPGNGPQRPYGTAPSPAGSTHMAVNDVLNSDRQMAMLAHLLTLVAGVLSPLIIWLIARDQSAYVDYHAKEALNFQISMLVYWVATFFASLLLVGLLFLPFLLIVQFLFPILAAVASNRGEYYRYPLTIRIVS